MSKIFICPKCGDIDEGEDRCSCGLIWTIERYDMPHYALEIWPENIETYRQQIARKMTFRKLRR